MDIVDVYNTSLKQFGVLDDGRPRFRLTVTAGPHQIEKRSGTFQDWLGHIFIREYVGVREIPKYFGMWKYDEEPHWVIEQLLHTPMPDLPNWRAGSYEPLWVFPWVDGRPQLPPWRAIELFFNCLFFGPKTTMSDMMAKDKEAFEKEVELFRTILDDEGHAMHGAFLTQSGAAMPSNFEGESPLLRKG